MPKRSNKSFNCKLNKNFKDALKYKEEKEKEVSLQTLASYFHRTIAEIKEQETVFREDYAYDMSAEDLDDYDSYSSTNCCGIDELVFENVVDNITRDTSKARHVVAKVIQSCNNNDQRILFVGLPLKKDGAGQTGYNFKNYAVIRRILMDFGFVQAHKRLYKNTNSSNMLSVLVGQFP